MLHHMSQTAAKHQPVQRKSEVPLSTRILGVVGEILITIGIIIGLFIVWQLWWTGLAADRAREEVVNELSTTLTDIATPQEGPPPVWTGSTNAGDVMGLIKIPRFGKDYAFPIRVGTYRDVLNSGAYGWYPQTQKPGELGNFALAAHRLTYGDPLKDVENLKDGDSIVIETKEAFLVYKMIDHKILNPSDGWTVLPDPFAAEIAHRAGQAYQLEELTKRYITLTTCHPMYVSSHRWVVYGEFEYWTKRSEGIPPALADQK